MCECGRGRVRGRGGREGRANVPGLPGVSDRGPAVRVPVRVATNGFVVAPPAPAARGWHDRRQERAGRGGRARAAHSSNTNGEWPRVPKPGKKRGGTVHIVSPESQPGDTNVYAPVVVGRVAPRLGAALVPCFRAGAQPVAHKGGAQAARRVAVAVVHLVAAARVQAPALWVSLWRRRRAAGGMRRGSVARHAQRHTRGQLGINGQLGDVARCITKGGVWEWRGPGNSVRSRVRSCNSSACVCVSLCVCMYVCVRLCACVRQAVWPVRERNVKVLVVRQTLRQSDSKSIPFLYTRWPRQGPSTTSTPTSNAELRAWDRMVTRGSPAARCRRCCAVADEPWQDCFDQSGFNPRSV